MRVFVTGGSGVLGTALIPLLRAAGHRVDALSVSPDAADAVRRLGADPVPGDLLAPGGLSPIEADALIHMATSIPRPDRATGSWERNDRIRRDGTRHLLDAAAAGAVGRVVAYSVIWVYGDHGDAWVTEETPLPTRVRPEIESALALERAVTSYGFDWVVVRGGHLYGPGTGTTEQQLDDALLGRLSVDGGGDEFDSMVHVDDTAQGIALALDRIPPATVVNVVDDAPLRRTEIAGAFAARAGGPPPQSTIGASGWGSLRVSNRLARSFGFRPRYPSLADGLAALQWRPRARASR